MGRYIITFDRSQEDIPVLMVGREENYYSWLCGSTPSMKIINTITGKRAVEMWEELTKEANK